MFDSLKKKLAGWLSSSKVTEDKKEEAPKKSKEKEVSVKKKEVKSEKISKSSSKPSAAIKEKVFVDKKKESVTVKISQSEQDVTTDEPVIEQIPVAPSVDVKSKGFFGRLKSVFSSTTITPEFFDNSFSDLEMILLESNVAFSVVDFIKERMSSKLVGREFSKNEIQSKVSLALRETIDELFVKSPFNVLDHIKNSPSTVTILFCGINGSGKTTTIAKFAHLLKANGISCCFAAADTFRAASIEQLAFHGSALGVPVIKQTYGSDPAAVSYDAIQFAKAKRIKVVLIDTAGRMHTKQNLIDELGKIVRVAKPDFKFFVGESITGNDATEQARIFNEAIDIDGIILTKADIDEKGGTAISVSKVTGKPIVFLGVGQGYESLVPFDKEKVLSALGL